MPLGERRLHQECQNVLCGLTGAAEFPYEAYDRLATVTYHMRTMSESIRSHGFDYNHGALFNLSSARFLNMVTYANFGKTEVNDVLDLCTEKAVLISIRAEGQCVVAVLPYGNSEWKKLESQNKDSQQPRTLDRKKAFSMIVVRAPNGTIFRQQCNYDGSGKYRGANLPQPFRHIFGSTRIRKICHEKEVVQAAIAVLGVQLRSWI
jgi:hypothetical protein